MSNSDDSRKQIRHIWFYFVEVGELIILEVDPQISLKRLANETN